MGHANKFLEQYILEIFPITSCKAFVSPLNAFSKICSNILFHPSTKVLSYKSPLKIHSYNMEASTKSLSSFDFDGVTRRQNTPRRSRASSLLLRAIHRHALRRRKQFSARAKSMARKPTIWKRWNLLEGSRKPVSAVKRKIRILQRLVPNSESTGLDELFEKAAEYIVNLQMQVKAMKIMVSADN